MKALKELIQKASDFDYPVDVRIEAIKQLCIHPYAESIECFQKSAAVDKDLEVRRTATEAYFKVDPEGAVNNFIRNLNHKNPMILTNMIHALRQIGKRAFREKIVSSIAKLLNHPNMAVRNTALGTIQKLYNPSSHRYPHRNSKPRHTRRSVPRVEDVIANMEYF